MAPVIEIDSLAEPGLEPYVRLTEAQLRNRLEPEKGLFIAESPKVIRAALNAGCRPLSLLTERRHLAQAEELAGRWGEVPVYTGSRELLAALTGYELTRGVLCAMGRPRPLSGEEVCAGARRLAVLEGVVDATNIGAIFRSAAALGVDGVLLAPNCCDPLNRRALRVSMGTVLMVPWAVLEGWPEEGLALLKGLGFQTAAMALRDDALPMDDPRLPALERLAVVLGAEGDGLAPDTVARCDYTVRIPMARGVDSLNVAAASAVAFWQLRCRD